MLCTVGVSTGTVVVLATKTRTKEPSLLNEVNGAIFPLSFFQLRNSRWGYTCTLHYNIEYTVRQSRQKEPHRIFVPRYILTPARGRSHTKSHPHNSSRRTPPPPPEKLPTPPRRRRLTTHHHTTTDLSSTWPLTSLLFVNSSIILTFSSDQTQYSISFVCSFPLLSKAV